MENKNSKSNYYLHVIPLVFIAWVSYLYRAELSIQDVEPIISILQNTAAMIFTIMGIWIAYLYPNAILRITQPSKIEAIYSEDDDSRIQIIVGVVVLSAIVLSLLMIGVIAKPFIAKSVLYKYSPEYFNFLGLFSLLILSYTQLIGVYIVIASNVNFIIDLKNKKAKALLNKRL
ncbi:hypothetical protein ACVSUJ_22880 [Yersinia enterocolitica]|nr:hypothetical protein [Yersinia enterocolitica]